MKLFILSITVFVFKQTGLPPEDNLTKELKTKLGMHCQALFANKNWLTCDPNDIRAAIHARKVDFPLRPILKEPCSSVDFFLINLIGSKRFNNLPLVVFLNYSTVH